MRIGFGYDVHRLVPDRKLIIGGVEIPNNLGLLGHSDADVLIHAIIDAILGSTGMPDIGTFFPDDSPEYKNIESTILLSKAMKIIKTKSYRIINIDSVIVCEKPKISPYVSKMKLHLSKTLNIDAQFIGIKCKTTEGLGFNGKMEGISAYATALSEKY